MPHQLELGLGAGLGRGVRQRLPRPGQSALPFHSLPLHSTGRGPLSPASHRLHVLQRLRLLRERFRTLTWPVLATLSGLLGTLVGAFFWTLFVHVLPSSSGCGTVPFISGSNCWWLAPRDVHKHFVFVYELPRRFHRDLLDKVTSQQQAQFQVDGLLFSFLQRSNAVRTTNPENASLFLIPALPTLYLALLESQGPVELRGAGGGGGGGGWAGDSQNRSHPVALSRLLANLYATSKFVEKALQHVQGHHPDWRRTNGRDHFIFASHPYGRCGVLPYVSPKALGELFTVQPCGYAELHLETLLQPGSPLLPGIPSSAGAAALSGLASSLKSTGCFHAGQDLVLPPLHAAPAPVSPLHAPRPVFVLAVLGGKGPSGAEERPRRLGHALMPPYVAAPPPPTEAYERHSVRVQFMETAWKERVAPKAWLMLEASVEDAAPEMRRAAMCVCLPDATLWQEVVCMTQAVLSGCIPVTFFHDHLHPWLGTFHFSEFSVNIDPVDVFEVKTRVEVVQLDPPLLLRLQDQLARVQPRFLYHHGLTNNTFQQFEDVLQSKADNLLHGTPLFEVQ